MVMGPTHSMSGAAVGLAVAQLIPASWGGVTSPAEAFVFAGIGAGAALLPDLDSPQATVSRSFGPASIGLSHLVENSAQALVNVTRTPKDEYCGNGHRTATHTIWFAIAAGLACSALVAIGGKTATIALLFFFLGLGLRGLFPSWSKQNDWLAISALSLGIALAVWQFVPASASPAAIGCAVAVGVLTHIFGDWLTKAGVPMLGGVVTVNGKRWWDFGAPGALRISANGTADQFLLGLFTLMVGYEVFLIGSGRTIADSLQAIGG
ncbi:hypothetical protein CHU70_10845 (plasmid) [Corynebacterium sp. LK10]|uniref:metal-dependent hydrolase n=1 Tax=Corynebacterium sp. LK10 TaxID=2022656 RepID=UPI0011CCC763|nr:hypothetical protein CHU70_10845 [Corynebacterium sp. LK10]